MFRHRRITKQVLDAPTASGGDQWYTGSLTPVFGLGHGLLELLQCSCIYMCLQVLSGGYGKNSVF